MKSPFPGMDPYLESPVVWEEFHHIFITECMYQLARRLPSGYVARIGERVGVINIADEAAEQYVPDISVARSGGKRWGRIDPPHGPREEHEGAIALAEPMTMTDIQELEMREGYIEIRRIPDNKVVTAIELLSPWNKYGEGIGEYRSKRRELVSHGVNVVEIDLLRRGARTKLREPMPKADYCTLVFLGAERPKVLLYAWQLRDPLPAIDIPLRKTDAKVPLNLADVVGEAYERGRLDEKAQYDRPVPQPALSAGDAEWVKEIVEAARI